MDSRKSRSFLLQTAAILALLTLCAGAYAEDGLKACTRYDYYTNETCAEVLVRAPEALREMDLGVRFMPEPVPGARTAPLKDGEVRRVKFPLADIPDGEHTFTCQLVDGDTVVAEAPFTLLKQWCQYNCVKIDRLTGGLIVDGIPTIPFGFYCYSPVQPTLAEEEVVKGFNMMSPYQDNSREDLLVREAYLNRCAELGMKVHYQLLSVAGGGGVMAANPEEAKRNRALLGSEVRAFKFHPALLGWYIADEPTLTKVSPESLKEAYDIIKRNDSFHPVTIVFMKPEAAREYAGAMDIVMADPYPIPHKPVTDVAEATRLLAREFAYEKPVWIVPQAFGGSEWWRREPTAREIRVMTYLSLIEGARGIQYFIRHGLNGFPKSTTMWAECGQLALETAELTPAILSGLTRPEVTAEPESVYAAAWRERNALVVLAANTDPAPVDMKIRLPEWRLKETAQILFEDRAVETKRPFFTGGTVIREMIDGYGTRAYRILLGKSEEEDLLLPKNRVLDPSFEDNPSVGVPSHCYANVGAGRGATYFIDARVAKHGGHSLRVHVPKKGEGCSLGFYPTQVTKGSRFRVSVWAKGRGPGMIPTVMPEFTLSYAGVGSETFTPTAEWQEFAIEGVYDRDDARVSPSLEAQKPGTVWFDVLQVVINP